MKKKVLFALSPLDQKGFLPEQGSTAIPFIRAETGSEASSCTLLMKGSEAEQSTNTSYQIATGATQMIFLKWL